MIKVHEIQYTLRLGPEYIKAKCMIFNGAKDMDINPDNNSWGYEIAAGKNNIADGSYVNAQYFVFAKRLEVIARYDWLNCLTNSEKGERVFKTTTIGLSYHFKGATRIDLNYSFRDSKASGNDNAQKVLNNTGNILSVQATVKF